MVITDVKIRREPDRPGVFKVLAYCAITIDDLLIIDNFKLYQSEKKYRVQEEILESMRDDIQVVPEKGWVQNRRAFATRHHPQ